MEVLDRTRRQEKETKDIQVGKEVKLSLFSDDTLYIRNPQRIHKMLLELINDLNKVAGDKTDTQKSVVFLNTSNEKSKMKLTILCKVASKEKYT